MANKRGLFYGLTTNIAILAVASFLTDVSSEMINPILPIFFMTLPGASMFLLGIIDGIAKSTPSFIQVFSGYYSDKIGQRKVFVTSGYGFSAMMKMAFAATFTWPYYASVRILERIGKGVRDPPRDAIIAESTQPKTVGKAFGFHRSMDTAGAILGPILSLILLPVLLGIMVAGDAYRTVFLLATIPAAMAFVVTFYIREKRKVAKSLKPLMKTLSTPPPRLKYFIVIATMFSLANFSYAFFLLRVTALTNDLAIPILFYLIFNIMYATVALLAGSLSDRVGRKPVIAAGYLLFAMLCTTIIFINDLILMAGMFVIYGIVFGLVEGTQRAFVSDLASGELKGTALGTYHAFVGLVHLPSSAIAGILWDVYGFMYTFMFGALVAFIAFIMLIGFRQRKDMVKHA